MWNFRFLDYQHHSEGKNVFVYLPYEEKIPSLKTVPTSFILAACPAQLNAFHLITLAILGKWQEL